MAAPSVRLLSVTFSDGSLVSLEPDSIVAICGPNNAGKSAALKNIRDILVDGLPKQVVSSIEVEKEGDVEDVVELVGGLAAQSSNDGRHTLFSGFGYSIHDFVIRQAWNSKTLQQLRDFFCIFLSTENRITDSNPTNAIGLIDSVPTHPIHLLQRDSRVESRISELFKRAFGLDLSIHHGGGIKVPIYVGKKPKPRTGENLQAYSYVSRLEADMMPLEHQGDGMRSFATILLRTLATQHRSVLLVDEPEAFLHPPQAKLLSEFLGRNLPKNTQILLSTHSSSVIQGLLQQTTHKVTVIRLMRDGTKNTPSVLDSAAIRHSWEDPLIRHSNVLDGIFHDQVIVCESDADCVFYNEILRSIVDSEEKTPDILFTHANGKHGAIKAAKALRALSVPVSLILDIDILNDEKTFRSAIECMTGDWNEVSTSWRQLVSSIAAKGPALTREKLRSDIAEILGLNEDDSPVDPEKIRKIKSKLKETSYWSVLKSGGKQMIPSGQPTKHYNTLDTYCKSIGIWIVPVGELESFHKSEEGGHGPAWLRGVLEHLDFKNAPELEAARKFVKEMGITS